MKLKSAIALATSCYLLNVGPALQGAVSIEFLYHHPLTGAALDGGAWFTGSDPSHSQRKSLLNQAANAITSRLQDSLSAITPNPGQGNTWTAKVLDPRDFTAVDIPNLSVPLDRIIVYVGVNTSLGMLYSYGIVNDSDVTGSQAWKDTVKKRGRDPALVAPTPWGGSLAFTSDPASYYNIANFYLDPNVNTTGAGDPPSNQVDFYSMAFAELCHAFGVGGLGIILADTVNARWWWDHVDSNPTPATFTGPAIAAANPPDGTVDLDDAKFHLRHDEWSVRSGTTIAGLVAFTNPSAGERRYLTRDDFNVLKDMGWTVSPIKYELDALGTLGGNGSIARAINANKTVAGYSTVAQSPYNYHPFRKVWGVAMSDLGTLPGYGSANYFALGMTDSEEITGYFDASGTHRGFRWSAAEGMVELPGFPGVTSGIIGQGGGSRK
jgi:probable HAF family extracellular repeat protein